MALFDRQPAREPDSDEVLAARYRESGDRAVLGELFTRYTHLVLGVAMKYLKNEDDARDLVMEVFEKLVTGLREHEVDFVKGWLYTVTRNAALMELRRRKRANVHEAAWETEWRAEAERDRMENDGIAHLMGDGTAEDPLDALQKGLAGLNAEQRLCLEFFYLQKQSYQEVAEQTGFSVKSVKSHLQNGKRNLRKFLETKVPQSRAGP